MRRKRRNNGCWAVVGALLILGCVSCRDYMPKPRGYFRIEFPHTDYCELALSPLPYGFEYSTSALLDSAALLGRGEVTLLYPAIPATLYCSFLPTTPTRLSETLDEATQLLYKQQRVEAVEQHLFERPELAVYGSLYRLRGDCVSPLQFVLTDSSRYVFRGALYYAFQPSADSIAPVTDYLEKELMRLIETFHWNR